MDQIAAVSADSTPARCLYNDRAIRSMKGRRTMSDPNCRHGGLPRGPIRCVCFTLAAAVLAGCGGGGGGGGSSIPPSAATVSLSASPTTVNSGQATTLSWTSSNATTCSASGAWSGDKPTAGSALSEPLTATSTFTLACSGAHGADLDSVSVVVNLIGTRQVFPVRTEPDKRHLVDAGDKPFLIQGDAAWSLIVQLTQAEVDQYLDDRKARGFNTLLVNLIEHRFSDSPPNNAYGQRPFLTPGDFSTPNDQYFAHADWVLSRAAEKGFLVLLVPAYLGYGGGDEGWYADMVANGSAKLRSYGRYLGQRYKDYTNILWTYGGDYNPPDRSLVEAIADGIREYQPGAPGTAHTAPETAAIEFWGGEPWLQVNTVYTYSPVYERSLQQYERPEQLPFFLLETTYENEHDVTTRQLRTQAYHALLSGAAGQVFGNNPIWHFNGPGLYPTTLTWQQALQGAGSRSMAHVWGLFAALEWWRLEPDVDNSLLTAGLGTGQDRAVSAAAGDRSFAIAYLPTVRNVSVNLGGMAGPHVAARWYDPTDGSFTVVTGSPFPASGAHLFRPGGDNSDGDGDWVLVLESSQ